MVSILQRPQGVILGDCITASIDEDYAGLATVNTLLPHNLSEDQQVYVTSIIGDYNGFWPVHIIDGFKFFLKNPDGSYVAFVQDASITYCPQESLHGWSCVELPIVYQARNDRYPTNEVDTARTILSYSNENNYLRLTLSGSLGTFEDLAWVKISGAVSEEVNSTFQIVQKFSASDVVLNLAYDSFDFTGASVILHYQNYTVVIDVYSGLPTTHRWYAKKPSALVATLDLIPDDNNEVKFSISDILKASINIENNTLLGTLPSNLDAFTGFYIAYGESYDVSDGYTITTFETIPATDSFQGWAANAKLEFKNRYSGFLTNYLDKFLTLFTTPVAFAGQYFDVSFILNQSGYDTVLTVVKKLGGAIIETENMNMGRTDEGIIRVPLEISSSFDQLCVQAKIDGDSVLNLADFANNPGAGIDWTTGANPSAGGGTTDILFKSVDLIPGLTYKVVTVVSSPPVGGSFTAGIFDASFNQIDSSTNSLVLGGLLTNNFTFVATAETTILGFRGIFTIGASMESSEIQVNEQPVTEELCIEVNSECTNQGLMLSWQNNLGGFDHWYFTGQKDYLVDVREAGETSKNIFPDWQNSYGEFADTDKRRQTYRDTGKQIVFRSDYTTLAQLLAIEYIKSAILVQIVNSRYDRRTVIVDTDSFTVYKDGDKLFEISGTITLTDDIPSQTV